MRMDSSANTWLAILAIATVVETIAIIAVLVMTARMVQRMNDQMQRLQRDHIEPMVTKLSAIADDVQDGIGRLRSADDEIRHVVSRGVNGTAQVVRMARNQMWPAYGVVRGAAAVVSFLAKRLPKDFKDRGRPTAVDRYPEGVHHVR
jgi:hypothetical protein